MTFEPELWTILLVSIFGKTTFVRFEIETSRVRLLLKWLIVLGVTYGVYRMAGHWALIAPLIAAGGGSLFHVVWCHRNGIHPLNATPRDRYYELRGWTNGSEWAPINTD